MVLRDDATVHLDVLNNLVTSSGCPRPAVQIAGNNILRLLSIPRVTEMAKTTQSDLEPMRAKVRNVIDISHRTSTSHSVSVQPFKMCQSLEPSNVPETTQPAITHADAPRIIIRTSLDSVSQNLRDSTSPPPPLNSVVRLPIHHLLLYPPKDILSALFLELRSIASLVREKAKEKEQHAAATTTATNPVPRSRTPPPQEPTLPASLVAISTVILTTPQGIGEGCGIALLPYTLKLFVPQVLATLGNIGETGEAKNEAGNGSLEIDVLCVMVGYAVLAVRHAEKARGQVMGPVKAEAEGEEEDNLNVERLVGGFVKGLEKGKGAGTTLLQKMRAVPEFSGHFIVP